MHLVFSTNDFLILGLPNPGFPIVLWEDMTSCEPVNEFLRYYLSRGAIGSKKSRGPTGQALYDFFSFLEAHKLKWDDVGRGEDKDLVSAYRDYCFDVHRLMRNTVRQRILYVCAFYKFALSKAWIVKLPHSYEVRSVANERYFSHVAVGRLQTAATPMPRGQKDLIKYLTKDEVERLVAAPANPHHKIIISLALRSGLRREELATFPASYVFDPERRGGDARNVRVLLDPADGSGMKTKGSKPRAIYISRRLMSELNHYATHWRGQRASLVEIDPAPLFLNQSGEPWAAGGKGIEAMVRSVAARVGLKAHPHMLRHTFATQLLSSLQSQRGETRIEPLVFIQRQLGHESITTTMRYLHLVNEMADKATFAYTEELDALCEELG